MKVKRQKGIIYQALRITALIALLALYAVFYVRVGFDIFVTTLSLAYITVAVLSTIGE